MTKQNVIWFGRYEGWLRFVARGVRQGDADCVKIAASMFDLMLPERCAIVPMPSHTGRATTMMMVAKELARMKGSLNRMFFDVLECKPHMSSYEQKEMGVSPDPVEMTMRKSTVHEVQDALRGKYGRIFVIDNVVVTGTTASGALKAIPNAMVCALAVSHWR